MPILNFTTQIEADRTLMEISRILTQHGATAILTEFDGEGAVAALSFRVGLAIARWHFGSRPIDGRS